MHLCFFCQAEKYLTWPNKSRILFWPSQKNPRKRGDCSTYRRKKMNRCALLRAKKVYHTKIGLSITFLRKHNRGICIRTISFLIYTPVFGWRWILHQQPSIVIFVHHNRQNRLSI